MKSPQLYKETTILSNTTTFTILQDSTTPLKPFGLIDMIDAYISQKRTEKENIYLPPESGRCYLPLLKACNPDNSKTTSYNVIMTYNPSSHVDDTQSTPLRVLCVNTLSHHVLTCERNRHHFPWRLTWVIRRLKYGNRLLAWGIQLVMKTTSLSEKICWKWANSGEREATLEKLHRCDICTYLGLIRSVKLGHHYSWIVMP